MFYRAKRREHPLRDGTLRSGRGARVPHMNSLESLVAFSFMDVNATCGTAQPSAVRVSRVEWPLYQIAVRVGP